MSYFRNCSLRRYFLKFELVAANTAFNSTFFQLYTHLSKFLYLTKKQYFVSKINEFKKTTIYYCIKKI